MFGHPDVRLDEIGSDGFFQASESVLGGGDHGLDGVAVLRDGGNGRLVLEGEDGLFEGPESGDGLLLGLEGGLVLGQVGEGGVVLFEFVDEAVDAGEFIIPVQDGAGIGDFGEFIVVLHEGEELGVLLEGEVGGFGGVGVLGEFIPVDLAVDAADFGDELAGESAELLKALVEGGEVIDGGDGGFGGEVLGHEGGEFGEERIGGGLEGGEGGIEGGAVLCDLFGGAGGGDGILDGGDEVDGDELGDGAGGIADGAA